MQTVPLDVIPHELIVDLDHQALWVLAPSANLIVRIDLDTGTVREQPDLGLLNPFRAAVVGDERRVLNGAGFRSAASASARAIAIVDIETNTLVEKSTASPVRSTWPMAPIRSG